MAVYTDALIATMALGNLNIGQSVDDLDGTGHLAVVCKRWFDHARDSVLERFDWTFATRQAVLALVESDPNDDWLYSYRYPDECLSVRRVVGGGLPQSEAIAFKLGFDDQGVLIFCDESPATVEYTHAFNGVGLWSSALATAISWQLAGDICGSLGKGNLREGCLQEADRQIKIANGIALRENQNKPRPPSSYVSRRN